MAILLELYAKNFLNYCRFDKKLNVIGLMVIPPNNEHTEKYFEEVSKFLTTYYGQLSFQKIKPFEAF